LNAVVKLLLIIAAVTCPHCLKHAVYFMLFKHFIQLSVCHVIYMFYCCVQFYCLFSNSFTSRLFCWCAVYYYVASLSVRPSSICPVPYSCI